MRAFLAFIVFCVAVPASAASARGLAAFGATPLKVVFSSLESGVRPETAFDCAGRVYAHMVFSERFSGPQSIEGHWVRPDGIVQEKTRLNMDLSRPAARKAVIWLEFKPENQTLFDEFSFGGDYGGEQEGFHGLWTLKIFCNKKLVDQQNFSVACYR